jgi:predicted dehydrogenase
VGSVTGVPRLAVAGLGLIGQRHARLIRDRHDCELVAVADPDPAAGATAAALGTTAYDSLDLLLSESRPDGVIVATPSELHVPHALSCIEAGVPVLVEKPIATSVADGQALVHASHRTGVPVLVGHHRRHSPILAASRKIVGSGALGDLVAVTAVTLFPKPSAYFEIGPWRRRPGGGPILINLIHDVDALRALAGDVVAVQAAASNRVRGFEVEDTAVVALRFASGALGTMVVSDAAASTVSWEMTAGEDAAFARQAGWDCYLIAGTRGSLGIPSMRLVTYEGDPSWTEPPRTSVVPVTMADPLVLQLRHFCDVIEGRAAPEVTASDALETLRVTLAVADAAGTGTEVRPGAPRP